MVEMCIRDRLEAEREELGQLICDDEQSQCHIGDMTGGNIGAAGLNAALKPVSYTHLDVYKRQGYSRRQGCPS